VRNLFLLSLSVCGLFAQTDKPWTLSYGFKVGSPLNDPSSQVNLQSTFQQSRWTGGPTVELHLPYRFAVEFDALFWTNRVNSTFNSQFGSNLNSFVITSFQKTNAWDLPLLLKYRFPIGRIRPFVTAGYLFTHESTERTSMNQCLGPQGSCLPPEITSTGPRVFYSETSGFRSGPTGGVGVEFKTRYLTIAPELRFSRLINTYPRDNRFTALVGLTFGGKR
jgi:hypothetical protein